MVTPYLHVSRPHCVVVDGGLTVLVDKRLHMVAGAARTWPAVLVRHGHVVADGIQNLLVVAARGGCRERPEVCHWGDGLSLGRRAVTGAEGGQLGRVRSMGRKSIIEADVGLESEGGH